MPNTCIAEVQVKASRAMFPGTGRDKDNWISLVQHSISRMPRTYWKDFFSITRKGTASKQLKKLIVTIYFVCGR